MIKTLEPGTVELWLVYQENNVNISGLSDLTVSAKYTGGSSIFSSISLVDGGNGRYSYNWDTSSIVLGDLIEVTYKKGSETLFIEEYIIDIIEDSDAMAM